MYGLLMSLTVYAQNEPCPYDTLLNRQIDAVYALLDAFDKSTLSPFIDSLMVQEGSIPSAFKKTTSDALRIHADTVRTRFLIRQMQARSCFECSVNKELIDYRFALLSLAQHLDKLPQGTNSGFRYNDVMSAYHHLVSARSALMAMVDATLRYHQVQRSIVESEKRVKRHVTIWGAVTLGFATVLYLIHDDDKEK